MMKGVLRLSVGCSISLFAFSATADDDLKFQLVDPNTTLLQALKDNGTCIIQKDPHTGKTLKACYSIAPPELKSLMDELQ